MLNLIARFFTNKKMKQDDILSVLNCIAKFNINDEFALSSVKVDGTIIEHSDVYKMFHERFNIVTSFYEPDEYAELSFVVVQCVQSNNFYRFSFEYDSYSGQGGFDYQYGTWEKVKQFTKTITYYSDY